MNSIDQSILIRSLRSITMPARRHKCQVCMEVFECNICGIDDDHTIHSGESKNGVVACSDCVEKHELYVTILSRNGTARVGGYESQNGRLSRYLRFYDSLTGEVIGSGCYRRSKVRPVDIRWRSTEK